MAEQNCLPAGHPPVEGYQYCAGSDQGSDDSNNNTDSDSQGCLPPGHVPVDGYDYCTGDETDSDSDSQSTQNTVLYNTTTHESVSTSNLDGSGWTLLDPERFPDYTHPAYYNTTKHFAIDSSAGSTNQGWILTAGRGAETNKGSAGTPWRIGPREHRSVSQGSPEAAAQERSREAEQSKTTRNAQTPWRKAPRENTTVSEGGPELAGQQSSTEAKQEEA